MRNLARYPVTAEEKLRALDWAVQQALATADQRGVGDLTAAALQEAREDLVRQHAAQSGGAPYAGQQL